MVARTVWWCVVICLRRVAEALVACSSLHVPLLHHACVLRDIVRRVTPSRSTTGRAVFVDLATAGLPSNAGLRHLQHCLRLVGRVSAREVPWRGSPLTRLLRPAISGTGYVSFLFCAPQHVSLAAHAVPPPPPPLLPRRVRSPVVILTAGARLGGVRVQPQADVDAAAKMLRFATCVRDVWYAAAAPENSNSCRVTV
jgi:hypothetical protein